MSCIYGPRQFGVEDQGWVAWFTIATLTGKPITIYGDGKQVRDILYIDDLIQAFYAFLQRKNNLSGEVFNIGGGPENTLSLLELLDLLELFTGKRSKVNFSDWRPSDQKVYISDITKARKKLGWSPKVGPIEGVKKLVNWVMENKHLFK
jgi:CDP-paratose 2-epimerase